MDTPSSTSGRHDYLKRKKEKKKRAKEGFCIALNQRHFGYSSPMTLSLQGHSFKTVP